MKCRHHHRHRLPARRGYSRKPWRVVEDSGEQVFRSEQFDHPILGGIVIDGPVCFDRKRDAIAWLESQVVS